VDHSEQQQQQQQQVSSREVLRSKLREEPRPLHTTAAGLRTVGSEIAGRPHMSSSNITHAQAAANITLMRGDYMHYYP
jgi:hypothetical protein